MIFIASNPDFQIIEIEKKIETMNSKHGLKQPSFLSSGLGSQWYMR